MNNYEATIGLEIHAELKTNSKMFCDCKNDPFNSEPNINVCPVCAGFPGTLPTLNKQAIDWTILTGLALGCDIGFANKKDKKIWTKWDRKHYFYPDLPKGYQISQYDMPLCHEGKLEIRNPCLAGRRAKSDLRQAQIALNQLKGETNSKIRIKRIHLEEDTGSLKHPEGKSHINYSLVDYNRAGVPLMELVTEPDIHSALQAKDFCKKYQLILRYLNVSEADMEKGQMRCEANISVRNLETDKELGTKVEVKNLNSFKAVEKAIDYEIKRQIKALEKGEKIEQETRGWNDSRQITYVMRKKESAADYRYFPEPDLPPVSFGIEEIIKLKNQLPELPDEKQIRYIKNYQLSNHEAEVLVNNLKMNDYFEKAVEGGASASLAAKWLINEMPDLSAKIKDFVALLKLIENNTINNKLAKEILPRVKKGECPTDIINKLGLKQIDNESDLVKIVRNVMENNKEAVEKIKSGKTQTIGFLIGQIMRETKGQANPGVVNKILNDEIKKIS